MNLSAGSDGQTLTESESVVKRPGESHRLTCTYSGFDHYYTAWIRQPAGKGLEWIGMKHGGGSSYYKESLKNKFSIDAQSFSSTVTLTGQNVQPEDSAVYYCARYDHSDTNKLKRSTKTPNGNTSYQTTRGGALNHFYVFSFFLFFN
uniref:Ig-like domain-containing protein n=1 Tax=Poecilia reticulata TaxID=8081 RepID=A0A3P9MU87_POERE